MGRIKSSRQRGFNDFGGGEFRVAGLFRAEEFCRVLIECDLH